MAIRQRKGRGKVLRATQLLKRSQKQEAGLRRCAVVLLFREDALARSTLGHMGA